MSIMTDEFDIEARQDAVADAIERARLQRVSEITDLHAVLSTEAGRRFIWRELAAAGVFHAGFAPDPHRQAFEAGRRAFAVRVLGDILAEMPEVFVTMQQEAKK